MFLTVGEIAKVLGMSTESIRYYVREGLITPVKNQENNYWEYSSEDVLRISDILFYRSLNLSINDIRKIFDGMPVEEIGQIIKSTQEETRKKIQEYNHILDQLNVWEDAYAWEISLIDNFIIGKMPTELRRMEYYDEKDHIANYMKGKFHIGKDDWIHVSLSFYCNLKEKPLLMHRYMSVEKNMRTREFRKNNDVIEEKSQKCIITQVHFSENIHDMVDPLIAYAEKMDYKLTGEIYGRERTNYFKDGKRNGLYAVYAPIE